MANGEIQVRPGDVISSDLFNYVLRKLEELEARLEGVGSGGDSSLSLQLGHPNPLTQQAVGQVLELTSPNATFLFPPGKNEVRVGSEEITEFLISTTSSIRFNIPELAGVPGNFVISVANEMFGSDSLLYHIIEGATPPGDPPTIEDGGIVHEESGAPILVVGEGFVINGEHFAATPSENRITLLSLVPGFVGNINPDTGRRTGDVHDVTEIDAARSTTEQIFATLPSFGIRSLSNIDEYRLSLEVGAHQTEARARITD